MAQERWVAPPDGKPWARSDERRLQLAFGAVRKLKVVTTAADMDVTSAHDVVLVDATSALRIVALPLAADRLGIPVTIKKLDATANGVSVLPKLSETIDGTAGTFTFTTSLAAYTLISDGTAWWII